jgi:hypothetical protein
LKLTGIDNYSIAYRLHASKRMFEREVYNEDIEHVLKYGEIIESYDDDYPLPSMLINGMTQNNRALHLVVAVNHNTNEIIIITVYEPNSFKWLDNFSRRIK